MFCKFCPCWSSLICLAATNTNREGRRPVLSPTALHLDCHNHVLYMRDAPALLEKCKVNKADRHYQLWKRDSLDIELFTEAVFNHKIEDIHYMPVEAGHCKCPDDYYYSSDYFFAHVGLP